MTRRNYAARALYRRHRDNRTRFLLRQIEAEKAPCPMCRAPYEAQDWAPPRGRRGA